MNADRHVEYLKLDAVDQVLAVPIKDPGYGTTKAPGRFSGVPSAGEVFTTDLREETRL